MNFDSKQYLLIEMLELRKLGWTYHSLAKRYGKCDSAIRWQCVQHKVKPTKYESENYETETIEIAQREAKNKIQKKIPLRSSHKYDHIFYEKINGGANYEDYLRRAGIKNIELL